MGSNKIRILSVDPGSRTLGLSILEFDFDTGQLTVIFTTCLDVEQGVRNLRFMEATIGTRLVRLKIISDFMKNQLEQWMPSVVVMETPYMGSHAQAFKVLIEVTQIIERSVKAYSQSVTFFKIDPSSVKKLIGVPGNSGDKDLMLAAVKAIKHLVLALGISLDNVTEHEIDAIAIGNYYCVTIIMIMLMG